MIKRLGRSLLAGAIVATTPANQSVLLNRTALADATANDNTTSAGTLRAGVLSVKLFAEVARWFPGPDSAPPVETQMFGEEGKAPSNPGPLLRMPLGTRVDLALRNALPDSMLFA